MNQFLNFFKKSQCITLITFRNFCKRRSLNPFITCGSNIFGHCSLLLIYNSISGNCNCLVIVCNCIVDVAQFFINNIFNYILYWISYCFKEYATNHGNLCFVILVHWKITLNWSPNCIYSQKINILIAAVKTLLANNVYQQSLISMDIFFSLILLLHIVAHLRLEF